MADLAEQPAALPPVVVPVPVGHRPGGDPVHQQLRGRDPGEHALRGEHGGGPAPVEADRELAAGLAPRVATASSSSSVSASGFSHHTCRPAARARAASSACVSCGVAITTTATSGSSRTASAPGTAFSKPCRSAARRADRPLAEATATRRSKPAARKAGSSVPVENAPAPTQPIPGDELAGGASLSRTAPSAASRSRRAAGSASG